MEPHTQQWLVQPLVDAGLELEHIRTLVFRFASEAVLSEGLSTLSAARAVVDHLPPAVQTAWAEMIGRMVQLDLPST